MTSITKHLWWLKSNKNTNDKLIVFAEENNKLILNKLKTYDSITDPWVAN